MKYLLTALRTGSIRHLTNRRCGLPHVTRFFLKLYQSMTTQKITKEKQSWF